MTETLVYKCLKTENYCQFSKTYSTGEKNPKPQKCNCRHGSAFLYFVNAQLAKQLLLHRQHSVLVLPLTMK